MLDPQAPDAARAAFRKRAARAGGLSIAVGVLEVLVRLAQLGGVVITLALSDAPTPSFGEHALGDLTGDLVRVMRQVTVPAAWLSLPTALVYLALGATLIAVGVDLARAGDASPAHARLWAKVALVFVALVALYEQLVVVPFELGALRAAMQAAPRSLATLPDDMRGDLERGFGALMMATPLLQAVLEALWPAILFAWAGRLATAQAASSGKWESPTSVPSGQRT